VSAAAQHSRRRVVAALSRVEGWQLVSHPIVLVGVGIALLGCATFVKAIATRSAISWNEDGWAASVGVLLLGVFTMVATNLAALRDKREHTADQHATLPVRAPFRTSGLLLATLWPAGVAALILAGIAVFAAISHLPPNATELVLLVERVVTTVLLGAIGIALAAWVPSPFVAPVVAWFLLFVTPGEDPAAWHSLVPWETLNATDLAAWHLVYLCGLTAAVALIALAKTGTLRALALPAIVSIAVVAGSGAVMLRSFCPTGCSL
jgi:hypothetical protein